MEKHEESDNIGKASTRRRHILESTLQPAAYPGSTHTHSITSRDGEIERRILADTKAEDVDGLGFWGGGLDEGELIQSGGGIRGFWLGGGPSTGGSMTATLRSESF